MQVNRKISDEMLDNVDHALGRPLDPYNAIRNVFVTDDGEKCQQFDACKFWERHPEKKWIGGTAFCVSDAGKEALKKELSNTKIYGKSYDIYFRHNGQFLKTVIAKSRSAARYKSYLDADMDCTFMEYCNTISVRVTIP